MNATITSTTVEIPSILTAKTYFWSPAGNAAGRRSNEQRRLAEVENFLTSAGFANVSNDGETVTGERDEIVVKFSYRESCHNIYKHLEILRDGKRSNITAIKKLMA